jgi:uncharacterized protein
MHHDEIIDNTVLFVKETLKDAESGHDWFHIERVWKIAKLISKLENCNHFIVEMAALLHDIADSKFHNGNEEIGPELALKYMNSIQIDEEISTQIVNIIRNISFKGGHKHSDFNSIELQIVQDADRIDALGAIGIARAFNYGGFKNRSLYDPDIKPQLNMSKEAYKNSAAPTINHFYEKLLLLKDKMNTESGKKMAEERHLFMEKFLEQFYKEWHN